MFNVALILHVKILFEVGKFFNQEIHISVEESKTVEGWTELQELLDSNNLYGIIRGNKEVYSIPAASIFSFLLQLFIASGNNLTFTFPI